MKLVNVQEMARARETRKVTQLKLLNEYNLPILSFTLNIPGPEKNNKLFMNIHNKGIQKIIETFEQKLLYKIIINKFTGSEAYFVINETVEKLKWETIFIEENHPLGRIFDIDVIGTEGKPFSRRNLKVESRKCLCCNEIASFCSRSRKHTVEELLQKIYILSDYLKS